MNKFTKYLFLILATLLIYFVFFHETKIVNETSIKVEEKQIINKDSTINFGCYKERMKWKGHLRYTSGPFYDINVLERTTDLTNLIDNKESITKLKMTSLKLKELPEELFLFTNFQNWNY